MQYNIVFNIRDIILFSIKIILILTTIITHPGSFLSDLVKILIKVSVRNIFYFKYHKLYVLLPTYLSMLHNPIEVR